MKRETLLKTIIVTLIVAMAASANAQYTWRDINNGTIAPDLSYKNLAVNNGDDASVLFMQMMQNPDRGWSTERKFLLEYCALDTYAMVRIFKFLSTIVQEDT